MCHASCCHAFRAIDLSTGSSASFAIPVFMDLEGWRLLYSNLIRDSLYLVWYRGAAIGVHYRFLGAISESCLYVEDQCSCPHPYQRCAVWQVHKDATPHNIHHTPFMCLSTWIDTLILYAQVYAHTASRFFISLLNPAHVTLYLSSLAFWSGGIIWDSAQNIIKRFCEKTDYWC